MMSQGSAGWFRNRFVGVAVVLLVSAGAVVLAHSAGSESEPAQAGPADLRGQVTARVRTSLEQLDPGQHQHAGHDVQRTAPGAARTPVVCGVRVYGFEPAGVTALTDVRTVYGFHLCGLAEPKRPWDVAVKLAGAVIVDLSVEPAGVRVVEGSPEVKYVDRLREMFPDEYEQVALTEALPDPDLEDLRRRYDVAAGL